ncbi:MAG: nucleotidyltransferase family protein [Pseudomonadota bacterium]|nr:nucleotidyltransferase family protein [Pseudomonadota bacterium]
MKDWKNSLVKTGSTIRDAVEALNVGGFEIALVVDDDQQLHGTITDGDIRRGLLSGLGMFSSCEMIMNADPQSAGLNTPRDELLKIMAADSVRQIPLLDKERVLVGLVHKRDIENYSETIDCDVVLMAGGLGERLLPLTKTTPKPLLNVGENPLLQNILEDFVSQNFKRFFISVNYMAELIKGHFGDGKRWSVEINYLDEDERGGTAGALRLFSEKPSGPFIVMNGDLVTKLNFQDLLDFHRQQKSKATMCVRETTLTVPFGVVDIEDNCIKSIQEKPTEQFYINAGIYVLEPEVIDLIPAEGSHDMTDLFSKLVSAGENITVFPIHEYWLDIGRIKDLERANVDLNVALST